MPIALVEAAAFGARAVFDPGHHRRRREALAAIELVHDVHAASVIERVRRLAPDLGLIYGGPILRPELIGIPRLGTLGIHHGRLPEYRGKKTTFWEIYHGEREAYVTIQRVDAGIDTGEVIAQAAVPIGRKSYPRVWREVQAAGVDLYVKAILAVASGEVKLITTTGKRGQLYKDPSLRQLADLWLKRIRGGRAGHRS